MTRVARRRHAVAALLVAALSRCTSSLGANQADAAPRDAQCMPSADDVMVPDAPCPERVEVVHVWSGRTACDRVVPRCAVATECRFTTHLVAPPLAGCDQPGMEGTYASCRCEFGVIECPGGDPLLGQWPGCVGNSPWCYQCNAAPRDR